MEPYKLTKQDIAALRKMDSLSVYRDVAKDESRVTCTKEPTREEKERDPFVQEVRYAIGAPVRIKASEFSTWSDDTRNEATKGARAFAHISIYREQITHAGSILRLLRAGDEIGFEFRADSHSNGYVARARLHADVLALLMYREGKLVAEYELDHGISPDNSARMVKHVAPSKWWLDQASAA
jgi:hypothetical protein